MRIRQTIYFDHQATTSVDERVLAAMMPYFADSFGNPHSSEHSVGWESSSAVERASAQVARLIGADPDEVIFTSGATESNNLALLGLGRRAVDRDRKRVLVTAVEHKCVHATARILETQLGFSVEQVPVGSDGLIDICALEQLLGDDVFLLSAMAVNNEIGTIQNVERIGELARHHGALFHCDAAQAPMAIPTRGLAKHTDLLSLSAHKMYGPKGIGVLYVDRELHDHIEPMIYGGGQQSGLRSGTIPTVLCVGMGAASEIFLGDDIEVKRRDLGRKRDSLVRRLKQSAWPVVVNGVEGQNRHPGNANVRFPGFDGAGILGALQPGLAASTGAACASGIPEQSHVLRAIGLNNDDADASIRFSLGFDTTDDDVENAVRLIEFALERVSTTRLVG